MNSRAKKIILLLLAAALMFSSGLVQKSLNSDRARLGLTHTDVLKNAPPMLAFTTVALGGFRGLISNFLWIRFNDLQDNEKYFEAVQLADWITDLEPHYSQVWIFQAWNMAFNISVKFKDFADRWRWVNSGIALLRDQGLRYNPDDVLIHRELAWFFQFKMGGNFDDANVYYKQAWARDMTPFFGADGTNFDSLIHPLTAEQKTNALVLREKYKIDPVFAQKVDAQYGPLDWRLPEAHAIYWGAIGLDEAKINPDKVKADDLIQLRRIVYQSMQQTFYQGRLISNPFNKTYALAPNLDIVANANDVYLQMYADETDQGQKDGILRAHRNFLKDAVYFLYGSNRSAEAAKWYKVLGEKYPDKPILDNDTNSLPRNLTLDDYAVARVQSEIGDTSHTRTTAVVRNLITQSYTALALGQDDRFEGFKNLARKVYDHYMTRISGHGNEVRVGLAPFDTLDKTVLDDLLNTQKPVLPFEARAVIRTQLRMLPETNAPAATISTNAAPTAVSSTNTTGTATNISAPAASP
jgi:hypothetical protein